MNKVLQYLIPAALPGMKKDGTGGCELRTEFDPETGIEYGILSVECGFYLHEDPELNAVERILVRLSGDELKIGQAFFNLIRDQVLIQKNCVRCEDVKSPLLRRAEPPPQPAPKAPLMIPAPKEEKKNQWWMAVLAAAGIALGLYLKFGL